MAALCPTTGTKLTLPRFASWPAGNMGYCAGRASGPGVVLNLKAKAPGPHGTDATLCASVPIKMRMSLRERTRPGLGIIEPCRPQAR
jgi:hypothetical protein